MSVFSAWMLPIQTTQSLLAFPLTCGLVTVNVGPILLGHDPDSAPKPASDQADEAPDSWQRLPRHEDEDQVQLDVNRAFIYYPNSEWPTAIECGYPSSLRR
jgi:hypothetical protein